MFNHIIRMTEALEHIPTEPPLEIKLWRGTSDKLVVVFSGVGETAAEPPDIEFFRSATEDKQNNALFVSDHDRTWLNGDGMAEQIVDAIDQAQADTGARELHLMGNSMGGTMALLLKDKVPAKTVLSLTPQYSVDPEIIPEETRWMRFRNHIKTFRYREIFLRKTPGQEVFIVHGGTEDELRHAERFDAVDGVKHFILPDYNHKLSQRLKRKGQLDALISAALNGQPVRFRRLIERHGGMFIRRFRDKAAA
ncbi:hypothetical protein [Tropicibacter naphthalenivorans]|uniref:Acetoin dehydrogenase E2 subunit dihydrolipoyllysine-residue acetyltransferase n=1 Tax=Tropicibacter naphthalenivorans TaxID=441103 RepID=A0A0P1GSW5_9RHOB|nr:hypothetical protein [Tropicibacter naphthalenivorans]CUH78546.1 hypothetical protein TRN7648_02030 [Tropicibacter naphthalenivorans]SMC80899.1 hypothetical protein SAMN04488093_104192 [Tropicibacter naphthalenivorans]